MLDFATYMHADYQTPRHIVYLADLLERCERGEIRKLAISAPPGHGKSRLLQTAGAWFLGRARRRLLLFSASESLSVRNSRAIRDIVTSEAYPWPARLRDDSTSVLAWQMTSGSEARAHSALSTVTGFRADFAILDDIQPDLMTGSTRDELERWLRAVMDSRMEPGSCVVLLNTRWSTDDIIARLQQGEDASQWTFVNLEAICETTLDPLGREIGEALWPQRWSADMLREKKATVGSAMFSAEYQGQPIPEGGRIFAPEMFSRRYERLPVPEPKQPSAFHERFGVRSMLGMPKDLSHYVRLTAVDCAGKLTSSGSYSAFCTLMTDSQDVYVIEVERARLDFEPLRERLLKHLERWKPDLVLIENASMGARMIGALTQSSSWPIRAMEPTRSKTERALEVIPLCEGQRVLLPARAPWLDDFLSELFDFPDARHDDQVDVFVWGLREILDVRARRQSAELFARQVSAIGRDWMAR